jgi:tripartite-type tricarboxylate transporter receptor subunit TctC
VVERLNELLRQAIASDDYQELSRRTGNRTGGNSPEEFAAFVLSEIELWGSAVRAAGIEVQ